MNEFEARLLVGTTNAFALFLRAFCAVFGGVFLVGLVVGLLGHTSINFRNEMLVVLLVVCGVAAALLGLSEQARRLRLLGALSAPPRPPFERPGFGPGGGVPPGA